MRKNILIKNAVCVLLCILILCVVPITSCNKAPTDKNENSSSNTAIQSENIPPLPTEHELNENGLVDVVVLKQDIKKGQKLSAKLVTLTELSPENLPKNAITSKSLIYNKYATRDLYKGDYIINEWLVEDKTMIPYDHLIKKDIDSPSGDYIVITDYVKANTGEDLYVILQEIIDKNPGRTLYFPDGEYVISHSLLTSSEPAKSTSFYLSAGATIKAADFWEKDGTYNALICLGAYKKVNDINSPGSNFFVMGGIFDCNGVADGISIDAGRETLIKNVVIVNSRYGIHVKEGTNGASADADIDDVTIIGNGIFNSIGVCFVGDDNSITNARISNVGIGMSLSNHTFVSSCTVENTTGVKNTPGFRCGSNVHLSNCTSINYDIAFDLGSSSKGCVKQCNALWTFDNGESHTAFSVGKLQMLLLGCHADFIDGKGENIFLSATEAGHGGVVSPSFDTSLISPNDMTKYYLEDKTSILDDQD